MLIIRLLCHELHVLLFSTHLSHAVTLPSGSDLGDSDLGDADEHEPGASSDLPGRSSDAVGKKFSVSQICLALVTVARGSNARSGLRQIYNMYIIVYSTTACII